MGRRIRAAAAALLLALGLAVPVLAAEPEALVPVGRTVGLELVTDGVYVTGFDDAEGPSPAEAAGLQPGDRLLAVNGQAVASARDLQTLVRGAGETAVLEVDRGGRTLQIAVRPTNADGTPRLGLRVRDRIAGLGTLTFYDPETGLFGALGHGVSCGGGRPLELREGQAAETAVTEIRRGEPGTPGSLLGQAAGGETLGRVERNTDRGLFGHGDPEALGGDPVPLAARSEVRTGPAEIWCSLSDGVTRAYAVEIEAIRFDRDQCRDLRLAVTDPRLLAETGGIVQGMSGSPILQDGKLVGAVTHVLVRDPTRGYGILIGHMLEACGQAKNTEAEAA